MYSKHLLRVIYTNSQPRNAGSVRNACSTTAGGMSSPDGEASVSDGDCPEDIQATVAGEASGDEAPIGTVSPKRKAADSSDRAKTVLEGSADGEDVREERGDEAAAAEVALCRGIVDPEMPSKPDLPCAPRSLAVHPDGMQVTVCALSGEESGRREEHVRLASFSLEKT